MRVVIALDFETADRWSDSACALGMTRIIDGRIEDHWYNLIRPPRSTVHFTDIHGLTWEILKNERRFSQLWPEISAFIEGAELFVAHNASFDRRILSGCCDAAGILAPSAPFVCTVKGSRRGLKLPHNRLCDVCDHLGIALDHHHAASDAHAAAQIYLHLLSIGLTDEEMLLK